MSSALLQAFSFVLADYATEHKLLPTLYNNQRNYSSFEPPPSPQTLNNSKSNDENSKKSSWIDFSTETTNSFDSSVLTIDRSLNPARTFTLDAVPTTPTIHSRRVRIDLGFSLIDIFLLLVFFVLFFFCHNLIEKKENENVHEEYRSRTSLLLAFDE